MAAERLLLVHAILAPFVPARRFGGSFSRLRLRRRLRSRSLTGPLQGPSVGKKTRGRLNASVGGWMDQLPDEDVLRQLISEQFAQWSSLPISKVLPGGWDNVTFRLGGHMLAKLPRSQAYSFQAEREHFALQAHLGRIGAFEVPQPVALGKPSTVFPYPWSILRWIEGEPVLDVSKPHDLPRALAEFLLALHCPAPSEAPEPGSANFWRGGPLSSLTADFERALATLPAHFDREQLRAIWHGALATTAAGAPVWVHGDIAPTNLITRGGRLVGVIDFGLIAAGDPACDLAIAWLAFDGDSRESFLTRYGAEDLGDEMDPKLGVIYPTQL